MAFASGSSFLDQQNQQHLLAYEQLSAQQNAIRDQLFRPGMLITTGGAGDMCIWNEKIPAGPLPMSSIGRLASEIDQWHRENN